MRAAAALLALALVAGCATWQAPDPGQIPAGPIEPFSEMDEPVGPLVELGSGRTQGIGWRYAVYRSATGICLIGESPATGWSGCTEEPGDLALPMTGAASSEHATFVDGLASDEVEAVVVELADGRRIPATLWSLAAIDADGQAFLAVVRAPAEARRVVALDAAGNEIGTADAAGG